MWRKSNDPKAPAQPASKLPEPPEAPAPVKPVKPLAAPVDLAPDPPPAMPPAAPPAPVYAPPPPRSVVAHDTSAPSSLGPGLKIRGELSGSSDLFIDGEAQGKIVLAESRVTVGPRGQVQADIEAREIVIEGSVQGNLKARESIRLGASSRVQGSVITPRIGIDDGAKLRGKVEMLRPGESKSTPAATAGKPAVVAAAFKGAPVTTESE